MKLPAPRPVPGGPVPCGPGPEVPPPEAAVSSPPVWTGGLEPITDREFDLLRKLILEKAGIHLAPVKRDLLVARLARRLRDLGLRSFGGYYRRVRRDREELERMLDCICTNETRFFREPKQFEFLTDRVFPAWEMEAKAGHRRRRLRAWSAGCSTGEEPYSLAMCALEHLPGWEVDVLATDLSHEALAVARGAVWSLSQAEQIPRRYLERFMLRGVRSQEGRMKAGPELRSVIRFARLNLSRELAGSDGFFDLILCRNVLIYFHPDRRRGTLLGLLERLAPTGYLMLGHSESPGVLWNRMRRVIPTVYTASEAAG